MRYLHTGKVYPRRADIRRNMDVESNEMKGPSYERDSVSITFLGTGAADWPEIIPAGEDFASNRNWRRLSSVLVDNRILIDCGSTVTGAMNTFGIDQQQITDILITHTHNDHLSLDTLGSILMMRRPESSLNIWGHREALARIPAMEGLKPHTLKAGSVFYIGNTKIQALEANHIVERSKEKALHFLFHEKGTQWLYATDGAWFLKPTWMRLCKAKLDMIVWDATIGEVEGDYRIFEHNSLAMIRLMSSSLKKQGILNEDAHILLTHMALTLHTSHAELEKSLSGEGICPAYDGLCINLKTHN